LKQRQIKNRTDQQESKLKMAQKIVKNERFLLGSRDQQQLPAHTNNDDGMGTRAQRAQQQLRVHMYLTPCRAVAL
jgi:single-stranded DNA-binding protein